MFTYVNNCCGKPKELRPGVTRPPCGREILSNCGIPFQNTILDKIWGKPFWLRSEMQELGVNKPPKGPVEIEKIIRTGDPNGISFDPKKADPAFEWDNTDPIQPYSTCINDECSSETPGYWVPPEEFSNKPEWPLTERIAAAETDKGICDNRYYRLITHYPSVGRPYQTSDISSRSRGLMNSNIIPDLFPGKQIEQYNYTQGIGNIIIKEISHDKNDHTNTAYPGDYWISWWNAINPGKVKGYQGVDLFSGNFVNQLSKKIKCDSILGDSCYKQGCDGITFLDEENIKSNVIKVSSGQYHTCVLLDNSKCDCFGLTGTAGYTLSRPEDLKDVLIKDINCGLDFTIATLQDGLTGWGSNNSGCLTIPESLRTNTTDLRKLAVGGGHCVALLSGGYTLGFDGTPRNNSGNNVIEIWGNPGYQNRILKRPRIAIKSFNVLNGTVNMELSNPDFTEYTKVKKGELIPFWGDRYNFFDAVKEFEAGTDEFGLSNDPVSKELEFVDVWAGRRHIVGLIQYPVYISAYDLGKHEKDTNGIVTGIIDPYSNTVFSPASVGDISIRLFSWGNGMPGDEYDDGQNYKQSNPNYLFKNNSLNCNIGENGIPMHLLVDDYFEFRRIKYDDTFYGISDTIFLVTAPTANHTVFARKKFNNSCLDIIDDNIAVYRKNGDPALCDIPRGRTQQTGNITCDSGDCCCDCTGGTSDPDCCEQPVLSSNGSYYKPEEGIWSCCQGNGLDKRQCCNNEFGIMIDGWGDDRFKQLEHIGLRSVPEYYSTPYINKNLEYEPNLFNSPNNKEYSIKCAIGYDRTLVSVSLTPTEEELQAGTYTKDQYKSEIYYAGGINSGLNSTDCIKTILSANGGKTQFVNHLSAGYQHNIIIQNPDTPPKIDFPYLQEIDKSSNVGWRFQPNNPDERADTPRVLLRSMGNTADWYQPEFDLDSSSRLIFDLDVKITKYRKENVNGEEVITKKQELQFKIDKTKSNQQNGISVNLIGTRGDQRLKPFTGATCDCVWSDYATDSFKMGGHQGVILNHIGYDSNPELRDTSTAYQWIEFNQLKGSGEGGNAPGGHEQPWRNFESAATKAFNREYYPDDIWSDGPLKPKINYYYAPPNAFTHDIIEIPPGKFPSELSYYCRDKYAYGGNNNIIQNWCDPCFKGVTYETDTRTGWMGRLGCTGCEFNYNEQLCEGCTFNEYGVWDCPDTAPKIRDVYGYRCSARVFGDIIPDEIVITEDDLLKVNPLLKNKPIYQKEIIIDENNQEKIIWWNVGEVTNIKRKIFTFIPYDGETDEVEGKKILIRSEPIYFKDIKNQENDNQYQFTSYQYKSYKDNCSAYNSILNKYNSFGELSTPIEESWSSLNRYFIPRWASLTEDNLINDWYIVKNEEEPEIVSSYTEIDYPLVVVPAHGGDIGPKYNMEGYVDTEFWGLFDRQNEIFYTEIADSYLWALGVYGPPPRYAYNFMPLIYFSSFNKSRYIKDSIDFEYPFNKNVSHLESIKNSAGHYPEFRPNKTGLIEFTPPPPGVFFHAKDIAYQNLLQNNQYKIEPLAGDSETGCSSCSIPFTGAKIAAWGFDLQNDDIVNAITDITQLTGDAITDKEFGDLNINPSGKNGVWLGLAKDRFTSDGRIIKRARIMVPIDLEPGETIMFGRGVQIDNASETHFNDGYFYTIEVRGKFEQYPNDKNKIKSEQKNENYEYRWGRFNDECSCNSRISLEDPNYIDTNLIVKDSARTILEKYQTNPDTLTSEERSKLISGDNDTGGIALVQYANCENPITYLESGASAKIQISAGAYSGNVGLSDMSNQWPIWNKSMCGNGYNCLDTGRSFHIGADGNEIIDPLTLYSGKGPDTGRIWVSILVTPDIKICIPAYHLKGTGVRGFWSDWLSNRGYSNFYTNNSSKIDDDKDRVGGDIPFEASHPQGWLGSGFVNPTDGYFSTQVGGDSIGDLLQPNYGYDGDCPGGVPYNTTSGTQFSSMSLWNYVNFGKSTITENWRAAREECYNVPSNRPFDINSPDSDDIALAPPFPRTQNKKKQILKACCFGDNYLNETPSSITNSVLPDRYTYNVRKNKYRNLYNGMYRAHPINIGSNGTPPFRKWHGDPFNPADRDKRLKGIVTPVWADYWWAWDYNSYCPDGYNWAKNIKEWRHRRWELPLFLGVNKDNIATMFINDPEQSCTPETCSGLELYDTNYLGAFGGYKLGWDHRTYDSPTAQFSLNPNTIKWVESTRGANSSSVYNEITPPRACQCTTQSAAPPKTGTFYAMNNAIWYNCYFSATFPDIFGNDVNFSIDYSRWNPYFQSLGPGFINPSGLKQYSANISNQTWPS